MTKIYYNLLMLNDYCKNNSVILNKNYENINVTRDTEIYAICNTYNCCEPFTKKFINMIKYGAFCKKCTKNNQQINVKKTNQIKYGVDNPFQSEFIKEKIKNTNIQKYGVQNPTYSKEIRQQTMKKCLEKYGVEHTCKLNNVIKNRKEAILNKYGTEYPFQSKKYQEIFTPLKI
jgi:hypothetical protein